MWQMTIKPNVLDYENIIKQAQQVFTQYIELSYKMHSLLYGPNKDLEICKFDDAIIANLDRLNQRLQKLERSKQTE